MDASKYDLGSQGLASWDKRCPRYCYRNGFPVRKFRGFSLLEFLVGVISIGIIATILLNRLLYYQEAAEKTNMEYTMSMMKSALRSRMASLLIEGRAQEYIRLAQENPMDWLEPKPDNYLGKLANPDPGQLAAGNWYFDSANGTTVYLVGRGKYFQPDTTGQKRVRLRVTFVRNRANSQSNHDPIEPTDTVALSLVEPYKWF